MEFLRALWAVDHGLAVLSARMERSVGVTGPQRLALRVIGARDGMGPAQLAQQLHVHRSAAGGIVKRLEAKGLITRLPDPVDGRRWCLALTPAGRRIEALQHGTIEALMAKVLRDSTPAEQTGARRVLDRLVRVLPAGSP